MRFIISSTWGSPRSLAHFRHRPSFTVFSPSILEMNTTAPFFLHLEQSVGCILYLQNFRRSAAGNGPKLPHGSQAANIRNR